MCSRTRACGRYMKYNDYILNNNLNRMMNHLILRKKIFKKYGVYNSEDILVI